MGSLTSRASNEGNVAMQTTSNVFLSKWKCPWEYIRKYTLENNFPYKFVRFEIIAEQCPAALQNYINLISEKDSSIIVYVDGLKLEQIDIEYLQTLPYLLSSIEERGIYQIGNLKIECVE